MKIVLFLFMFFIAAALIIISNNNLALYQEGNFQKFSEIYFNWLSNVFGNFGSLTGNVVKMNWFPR